MPDLVAEIKQHGVLRTLSGLIVYASTLIPLSLN